MITTRKRFQRIFDFPLIKIVAGILVVALFTLAAQLVTEKILSLSGCGFQLRRLLTGILSSLTALAAYILWFRWYEKRKIKELSTRLLFLHLGTGVLLGTVLQSLTVLVIWISGGFRILSVNPLSFLLPSFVMAFTSAIFEELIVRGIIFRVLEEKLGTWIALVISAVIFGALHLANPNSSLLAACGLALQAGVFLAAAFVYTRNLWFPIAIHFAWNFTQGGIYGARVSGGNTASSLFTTEISGDTFITGGAFGPEGSVQATVFCFCAALYLLYRSNQKALIIPPVWRRSN